MSDERTIKPNAPADFAPQLGDYKTLQPFRYWCQKVLPLVYDDSLSYYELLCKVVDYLNKTMEDVKAFGSDMTNLFKAYKELESYVNEYFTSLDVQEEINSKLDKMAQDGSLMTLFKKYIGYVMPEWFGCKGDGVTDDTINMKKAIEYCKENNVTLLGYTPSVYLISDTLQFVGVSADFNNSTILINSALNDGIIVKSENYDNFPKYRKFINNLKLIALECINAITFNCAKYTAENISIKTKNTGINVKDGYENTFVSCNITGVENTIGINLDGNDHLFIDCICIDCKVGMNLRGVNRINNFHAWIYNDAIRHNSKTFDVKSGYNFLHQCYCDSTHYGIYWSNYGQIFSDQMFFLNAEPYYKENQIIPYCMYDSGVDKGLSYALNPIMEKTYINILENYKISNFNMLFNKNNKYILNGVTKNIYYLQHDYKLKSSYFTEIYKHFIEYDDFVSVYLEIKANDNITENLIKIYDDTFLRNNLQFNGLIQEARFGKAIGNCTFYCTTSGEVYLYVGGLSKGNVCSIMINLPKELSNDKLTDFHN